MIKDVFYTARPVVTDDDGFLGYLWEGLCFTNRHSTSKGDFEPTYKSSGLSETPEGAIADVRLEFENFSKTDDLMC